MYTAKIKKISKDVLQSTQEPFLDVEVEILDSNNEVIDTKKYGYAIDTPSQKIEEDVNKLLVELETETNNKEKEKVAQELNKQADETIENLTGKEIVK